MLTTRGVNSVLCVAVCAFNCKLRRFAQEKKKATEEKDASRLCASVRKRKSVSSRRRRLGIASQSLQRAFVLPRRVVVPALFGEGQGARMDFRAPHPLVHPSHAGHPYYYPGILDAPPSFNPILSSIAMYTRYEYICTSNYDSFSYYYC